jgi:hypothetical protein
MVSVYPVSGFKRICILQLRLTHPRIDHRNSGQELVCVSVRIQFQLFTQNPYHSISDQFHINQLQHLRTREAVRAISASSSDMHVQYCNTHGRHG